MEHLSVLYSSLWSSIRDSPSLVSLADTDQALDNRDVILSYYYIRLHYILSSGIGIMSVFSVLFKLPGQSLPVEKLINRYVSKATGYVIDDRPFDSKGMRRCNSPSLPLGALRLNSWGRQTVMGAFRAA